MAAVTEITSEISVLSYAEETSPKVLPVTPDWYALDPNSMGDFGANFKKVARNPIGSGRQRKKSVIVGLDAMGSLEADLTQSNTQQLFQGFFFADFRRKAELDSTEVDADGFVVAAGGTAFRQNDLVFVKGAALPINNGVHVVAAGTTGTNVHVAGLTPETAAMTLVHVGFQFTAADVACDTTIGQYPALTSVAKDFTQFGLVPGEWVYVGGDAAGNRFATANNNGWARVYSVAAHRIVFDKTDFEWADDAGTGKTIRLFFGRVLKNEVGTLIKARTYTFERTLGATDTATPNDVQAEYIAGAMSNEMTINMPEEDKITVGMSFVAMDYYVRHDDVGPLGGNRYDVEEEDAFNTSNDIVRLRMATIDTATSAPDPLMAIFTDLTLTLNNNVRQSKGLGYLGAVSASPGTFEVSGSTTAYFTTVESVEAVRENDDATIDVMLVKDNHGVAIDFPLLSLGNGKLNVEKDQSITIPLDLDASTGAKYAATMNHTALVVFFDYLPDAADARVP